MTQRTLGPFRIALVASLLAAGPGSSLAGMTKGSAEVSDEVRVSETSLVVEDAPADPAAMRVVEGGLERKVLRVERVPSWKVLIYVDIPLSDHQTIVGGARALAEVADELTGLGEVRLVVADAAPRDRIPPTRDSYDLREALLRVASGPMGSHVLVGIRNEFATALRRDSEELGEVASQSLEAELETVEVQLERLLGVAADGCDVGPCLLFLVTDGYDDNPRSYYSLAGSQAGSGMRGKPSELSARLGPLLSAQHWVVLPLPIRDASAPAGEPGRTSSDRNIFLAPGEGESMVSLRRHSPPSTLDALDVLLLPMSSPLLALARASGGSVLRSPSQLESRLRRIGGSRLIWYSSSLLDSASPLPVEVREAKKGKPLRSQAWVGSSQVEEVAGARLRGALEGWGFLGDAAPHLEVLDQASRGEKIELRIGLDAARSTRSSWRALREDGKIEEPAISESEEAFVFSLPAGTRRLAVMTTGGAGFDWGIAVVDLEGGGDD